MVPGGNSDRLNNKQIHLNGGAKLQYRKRFAK